MAQGFFEAFNKAVPQGVALGLQAQQVAMQQEQAEAEKLAQRQRIFMGFAEQVSAINKLDPELQKPMYAMLHESFTRATGEQFPRPLLEAFIKSSAEQGEAMMQAVGELAASTGFQPKLLSKLLREQPGALANVMVQAAEAKKAAEEQSFLQGIAGGGQAAPGAPQANPAAGRIAELDAKIAAIMQSGRTGAAVGKWLNDAQQERASLVQQAQFEQVQARQAAQFQQSQAMAGANLSLSQRRFAYETSPERALEKLAISQQQGLAAAGMKPLEAGERERLVGLDRAGQIVSQLRDGFTPEERAKYVGAGGLRFRGNQLQQLLQDATGGQADPRFAQFAALVAEAQAEAFRTGGKQLTAMEAEVVFGYVPTGRELSAQQFEEKLSGANERVTNLLKQEIKLLTTPRKDVGKVLGPDAPRQAPVMPPIPVAPPVPQAGVPHGAPPVMPAPEQPMMPPAQEPAKPGTLGELFQGLKSAAESVKERIVPQAAQPVEPPAAAEPVRPSSQWTAPERKIGKPVELMSEQELSKMTTAGLKEAARKQKLWMEELQKQGKAPTSPQTMKPGEVVEVSPGIKVKRVK